MADSLKFLVDAQNRLTIAIGARDTTRIVLELDRLHANSHFATALSLKQSGIAHEVHKLVRHSAHCVRDRSSSLVAKWRKALNIQPRPQMDSPQKRRRPLSAAIEDMDVQPAKRSRQAGSLGEPSSLQEIPTPPRLNVQRPTPCPSTPESMEEEPLLDAIMSAGGFQMSTVRVKIAPRNTLDKHGRAPLEMNWCRKGNDPIWKVIREWSESHLKLPSKRLPHDPKKFIEKGVVVFDAQGLKYDLTKTLTEAYAGRACTKCQKVINGVIHIQEGCAYHYGCLDHCQPCVVLDAQLSLQMNVEWPARALPKDWGKTPTRNFSRQCEVCGQDKVYISRRGDDGEIKTRVFCDHSRKVL